MSLVEVLAASVILSGAATSLLLAQAKSVERLQSAKLQMIARNLAHELITAWKIEQTNWFAAESGGPMTVEGWSWRRSAEVIAVADGVRAVLVTLELNYAGPDLGTKPWTTRFVWLIENARKQHHH